MTGEPGVCGELACRLAGNASDSRFSQGIAATDVTAQLGLQRVRLALLDPENPSPGLGIGMGFSGRQQECDSPRPATARHIDKVVEAGRLS